MWRVLVITRGGSDDVAVFKVRSVDGDRPDANLSAPLPARFVVVKLRDHDLDPARTQVGEHRTRRVGPIAARLVGTGLGRPVSGPMRH